MQMIEISIGCQERESGHLRRSRNPEIILSDRSARRFARRVELGVCL